jgi:hypothetical protein
METESRILDYLLFTLLRLSCIKFHKNEKKMLTNGKKSDKFIKFFP